MSTNAMDEQGTRTCVGCRKPASRGALLRFVLAGDPLTVVPDVRARGSKGARGAAMGRGASVHPNYRCLAAAVERGGFRRAFKRELQGLSTGELAGWARAQYMKRVEGLLSAAARCGKVAVGTDAVRATLQSGEVALLVVAEDAAGRRQELTAAAERLGRRCVVIGDKEHLGRLCGRASVGIVAILHEDIAVEVGDAMQCVTELAEDA